MNTLQVVVTEDMLAFVEGQAAEQGYTSPDEYLRALILDAQTRLAKRKLEAKFREAIESGPSELITDDEWDSIETEALRRLSGKTGS